MRVLVTSTGLSGHFGPLVPFLDALHRRGDETLVVVAPALAAAVEATGHPMRLGAGPPAEEADDIWRRVPKVSHREASVLVNRELFGRLCTAAMLPAVDDACGDFRPDLILREPCEFAAAVAAERHRVPHAQVAISTAESEWDCVDLVAPALEPYDAGIADRLRAAPYLTRFPRSLDPTPFPTTRRYREAATHPRDPLPCWWDRGDDPLVYVTFGSVAGGLSSAASTYRVSVDAFAGVDARVLLTTGRDFDAEGLGPLPRNVHVEAWVPQASILGEASVVVCHGGSGTTFGTLAAGVPLVIVPMFADHDSNAGIVAGAGAGVVVEREPGSSDGLRGLSPDDAPRIRTSVERVLGDTAYRRAAERLAQEMGAEPAADDLLAELGSSAPTRPGTGRTGARPGRA
jgi:UDP:flavonoid glycosyltransferase YjiC (YdhE family)